MSADSRQERPTDQSPRKATLYDVAEHAGVSHITVSRYFRRPEKLAKRTAERVREAVEALHYVPNAAARSLVSGQTEMVALIVPDITNTFYTRLARGVEDEARRQGYTLVLGNTDESLEEQQKHLDTLISHRVLGVLLAPTVGTDTHLSQVLNHKIPVVLIDRYVPGAAADLVRCDTGEGTRQLVHHLVERGHRDIVFVGGDSEVSSLQDRLSGYRQAIDEAGLHQRIYLGRFDRESGREIAEQLVGGMPDELPDAIIAANNKVLVGVLDVLRKHELHVPSDVAVACIDDIEPAAAIDPFLTVVNQPAYEMGRKAMELLKTRIDGATSVPCERVLPSELIIRKSSL